MNTQEKYKNFLIRFAYWGAIAAIVVVVLRVLLRPLLPFLIAFAVAAMLQPLMRWGQKHSRLGDGLLAAVLTALCYVLLVGIIVLLLVGLFTAIIDWASGLPEIFTETLSPWIEKSGTDALGLFYLLDPGMGAYVEQMLPNVLSALGSAIMNFSVSLVSWVSSVGTQLPGAMLAAVVCVIATAFLSRDYAVITEKLMQAVPEKGKELLCQARVAVGRILVNFIRSYALILLITFAQVFVGLLLIRIDNAAFIAALIALFDMLPIVGSGMILLPWTVFAFIQGNIGKGIGLLVLYLVVVVSRQIIEPKIVGKRVGLHPLSTLLFMWMGLKLFGGVGMLALPVMILILKDLHENGLLGGFSAVQKEEAASEKQSEMEEVPGG